VYLTVLVVMAVQRSKPYYLGLSYSMLLAAGAVSLEGLLAARRAVAWGRPALLSALGVGGVLTAPFAVPVLPVGAFIAYSRALGEKPGTDENHEVGPLPQFFADRFGWREMAQAVAGVYDGLPEPDKADVIIVTANYGEAGAIGYYGRGLGLPAPVSQHNSFFLWGPGRQSGNVAIAVGIPEEGLRRAYESVSEAARLESPYAMPYETREPIFVCRGLKLPLGEAWRRGKHFI
jgi:hypothetical protein